MTVNRRMILGEVENERRRQIAKWGEEQQTHPHVSDNGARIAFWRGVMDLAKYLCQIMDDAVISWEDILLEEVAEAFSETEWIARRRELIQVMAVACAEIEDGDEREAAMSRHPAALTPVSRARSTVDFIDECHTPDPGLGRYGPGDSEQNSAGAST